MIELQPGDFYFVDKLYAGVLLYLRCIIPIDIRISRFGNTIENNKLR
jgi:hypothetical protein